MKTNLCIANVRAEMEMQPNTKLIIWSSCLLKSLWLKFGAYSDTSSILVALLALSADNWLNEFDKKCLFRLVSPNEVW